MAEKTDANQPTEIPVETTETKAVTHVGVHTCTVSGPTITGTTSLNTSTIREEVSGGPMNHLGTPAA